MRPSERVRRIPGPEDETQVVDQIELHIEFASEDRVDFGDRLFDGLLSGVPIVAEVSRVFLGGGDSEPVMSQIGSRRCRRQQQTLFQLFR